MTGADRHDRSRARRLVYVPQPVPDTCVVCGHGFKVPCEAIRVYDRIAHVGCDQLPAESMRGGA